MTTNKTTEDGILSRFRKLTAFILVLSVFFTATLPSYAAAYRYDKLGRLVEIVYDSGGRVIYTYDRMGNIIGTTFVSSGSEQRVPEISTKPGALSDGAVGIQYSFRIEAKNAPTSFKITKGSLLVVLPGASVNDRILPQSS